MRWGGGMNAEAGIVWGVPSELEGLKVRGFEEDNGVISVTARQRFKRSQQFSAVGEGSQSASLTRDSSSESSLMTFFFFKSVCVMWHKFKSKVCPPVFFCLDVQLC